MADGKRVFVKPANSYREALAEQRATTIARNVHGLDAPEQTIKTILDPTDTKGKRRIVVLESPFDPRFDPEKMSNTFTKEEYIKQNVAAALRADKDLGKGNLSGNILADVGPAGVFGTASGSRDFVANLPSMEEQARINLGIDTPLPGGGRKKFFSEATAKIARSMTADEYHRAMINEINTSIPKLEKVIESFGITNPKEKKVYQAMLDRLKEGAKVDWRQLHKLHSSIAVKPDEVLQDTKTGKITKPKTAKLPSGVKSSAGSKDTRMTQEPAGKRIVQAPKRIGKVIIPGKANAPDATTLTTTSQSAAAASRTALYGGGTIDADAKSLRRQMEKRQRAEARTQAKAAASRTALYGQKVIDAEEKSFRRQREAQEKRSKLAERVAYRQSIISEKAAAEAAAKTPSARLKTFAQAKIDKYNANKQARIEAGKNPRMGAAGALGLASGAAMIGSMAPGKVGEISQKIMMPLMGLSMVLPMMKSPMSALAVGLIATVGSFVALRMAFDSAQSKVLEEADKFKGSASAVQAIAKFSGKATASEQMDLRRKNSFSMLGPATGKTTYGEAFVQTAEGKALTARISEQNAKGKGNAAAKDLTGQLSASIMSGAMDMSQAKSLAMNAARQAGDMSIGIKVIAQLESLLGPNGENLINDPLNVRINMINANAKSMQGSINNIGNANPITKLAGQKTMQTVGIGASALGGAAIGATIGAALGTVVPVLGNAVGAIIGGGIGAAAGAIGGYFASKKFVKEAGTLGAAYAVDAKMAMEQNKQMLDSFDMFYQKKIEQLKLQGKINEAEAMQTKYISERDKLTAAQSALQGNVVSQYNNAGGLQEAMMSGMKKATTAKYKNDPNQLAYVDVVNQQAGDLRKSGAINSGQEFLIQAKMASGDIPPAVFRSLLQMATDNKDIAPKMMNIITKFSGATSESIGVAAQNILGSDGVVNKTVQTKFVTRVEAFEKDSDALDFAKNIIKLNNLNAVIPSDVMVSYYTDPKNKDAYEKLNKILDTIEGSKDLTAKIVYEIMPEIKGTAAFDEAYFNTLTEDQQKVYTTTISSLINIPEPQIIESEDFKAWRKETGPKGGAGVTGSKSFIVQKYIEAQGNKAVTDGVAVGVKAPVTADTSGTGNKVQASPLDDLVKKLRDVRMNQIKVTEGWSASRKALDKLFGGKKTIDVFSGIENDIRKLGGSQDFIELIVGMDPKEYEKRKNSLFKFDNKGNIISLKNDAKNIQEAMNSIAMGDWNSSMEAESQALADQGNAFSRIANLGVPVADAYDLITNKTIAQAIANGVNDKTLKTLIERYKGLTAAQEKSAAIQGVKTDIAQFKKDRIQEARIKSQYDPTTAFAISSDDNLKLMENTISTAQAKVDSLIKKGATRSQINAAQGDLNTLVTDFNERLNQLKNTIGFMQDMFDKGYSNAMQSFDTQETALNIQFKLDTKGNDKTIREAQDQIAAIQYKVDGKDAALKVIADEEQKINDKYDERINALDEIEKVNAAIYSQQKGQLTLAEALTSGDIAAAARAAQDMRSQAAADAVTKQKDAVEQSRKYELAGVQAYDPVTKTYRTRKELESDIKKLQDEIFSLEQDKIKPAEELNRLRQIQLDKDVAGLTVLGRTKDAWEAIKNQVDLALIKSAAFVDSMGLAISTQSKLIAAYAAETGGKNGAFNNQGAFVTGAGIDPATQAAADAASQAAAEAKAKADAIAAMDKALKGKDDGTSNSLGFYNSLGSDGEKGKTAEQNAAADAAARAAAMDKALQGKDGRDAAGSSSLGFYNSLGSDGEKGNTAAGNIAADAATLGNQTAQGYANKIAAMDRAMRGRDGYLSSGGLVPKYFAVGGFARGTDTVPAMLTPGEFIMSKYAVDAHGINTMKSINSGQPTGGAVYNNTYTLTVNAKTDANPNEIAKAVMSTIKQVDDRRVRGVVLNGR